MGKAIRMPMAIKMAGLTAFFQNGFDAAALPSELIAPPVRGLRVYCKPLYVNPSNYSIGQSVYFRLKNTVFER
jgi:hypothetical protein